MAVRNVSFKEMTANDIAVLTHMEQVGNFSVRPEEARECTALGIKPSQAIEASFNASTEATLVFVDEELVAVWGHTSRSVCAGVGTIWVMTCPSIDKHKLWYARTSIRATKYLLGIYNRLEVLVAADYFKSIEWLEWLGFQKGLAAVMINGLPFMFMWKER